MPGPDSGDDGRKYRIVRRLGHGGMAEVFEALLSGTQGFTRRVAIKRISTRAADDPDLAQRFLDEARIASQLHHAGIVGVIDYGFVDGLPFQVLEFVDGLDADRLIERAGGRLPEDISLIIAADVARALDHAHKARDADGAALGIVHRDVKPANVLVSWDGDVKLSDFGIAMARDRVAVTEAGVARGTPWFMAPEQRTRTEIGPRADVFALGCTLHALLTGTSPMTDFEATMSVIAGDPAPLDPGLPPEVAEVIARACAPSPEHRFPDCAALADALGRLAARRLDRDARGRLRDYLAELRKPAAAGAGLLDQLLAVDLVLAGDGASGSGGRPVTRAFTLRGTQAPDGGAGPAAIDQPSVERGLASSLEPVVPRPRATGSASRGPVVDTAAETMLKPRRRAWLLLLGLVVLGAAGVGVGIAIRGSTGASTADARVVAIAEADAAPAPAPAVDAPAIDAPAPVPAPAADAALGSPDARGGRHRPDAARRERADADETPPPPDGTGYVSISAGNGRERAEYIIDGKPTGVYVPNRLEVATGRHKLELVLKNGTRLGPTRIEVTRSHTYTQPLRPAL